MTLLCRPDDKSGWLSAVEGGGGPAVKFARRDSVVGMAGGWTGAGGPAATAKGRWSWPAWSSEARGPNSWLMTAAAPRVPPCEAGCCGVGCGSPVVLPGPEGGTLSEGSGGSQPHARFSSKWTRLRFQPVW